MKTNHRIKLLRLLFGLTQEELSSLAGISRPALVSYEQGGYSPIDDIIIRLADIFSVEPGYLRYGSPVILNHVWIPSIPKHSLRKQNIIDELDKLFPELIQENRFTGLVTGNLADGNCTLLFGRDKNFDSLLLTNRELAEKITATAGGLVCHTIEDNTFGTIETFDADCLSFLSAQIEEFVLELDFMALRQALTRLTALKTRTVTNLDAVSLVLEAQHNALIRDRLLQAGDAASRIITGQSLEEIANGNSSPTIDVTAFSDQLSRSLCVIFKAAYDLMAKERQSNPSFPNNP
jgi:transcriptional regulator with XRE-family HTH domain